MRIRGVTLRSLCGSSRVVRVVRVLRVVRIVRVVRVVGVASVGAALGVMEQMGGFQLATHARDGHGAQFGQLFVWPLLGLEER